MTGHRFATGVAPVAPAPATAPPSVTAAGSARAALRFLRGISGLDAYERYVEHETRTHGRAPALSRAEFWRAEWDQSAAHPKPRCC